MNARQAYVAAMPVTQSRKISPTKNSVWFLRRGAVFDFIGVSALRSVAPIASKFLEAIRAEAPASLCRAAQDDKTVGYQSAVRQNPIQITELVGQDAGSPLATGRCVGYGHGVNITGS